MVPVRAWVLRNFLLFNPRLKQKKSLLLNKGKRPVKSNEPPRETKETSAQCVLETIQTLARQKMVPVRAWVLHDFLLFNPRSKQNKSWLGKKLVIARNKRKLAENTQGNKTHRGVKQSGRHVKTRETLRSNFEDKMLSKNTKKPQRYNKRKPAGERRKTIDTKANGTQLLASPYVCPTTGSAIAAALANYQPRKWLNGLNMWSTYTHSYL